jgi:hypothetical protein
LRDQRGGKNKERIVEAAHGNRNITRRLTNGRIRSLSANVAE